ncbi:hypothetical protein TNCV_2086451 [Trichonephila clavipes]|nr:hypothetical protein TNCV_2086451 [Trichonephila clavipes]
MNFARACETGLTSLRKMATPPLQFPALVVSAATTRKTFGPTDLTSTYSVCTRKVFGGIEHGTQSFRSGVQCSNH